MPGLVDNHPFLNMLVSSQTAALCIYAGPSAPRLNGLKGFPQKQPMSEITKSPLENLEKTFEKSFHVDGIL